MSGSNPWDIPLDQEDLDGVFNTPNNDQATYNSLGPNNNQAMNYGFGPNNNQGLYNVPGSYLI
ncbi:hypothetical protein OCU04_011272 [Sclerotinia nivalis]|uniref:Uncharacterized protein n=1 Tax=Sclerotinia nivalis TaxID=352851 RepID=A0A9X0ABY1_9HELO|nr:hypothetical protein OCU04_011272 [Sclerotinia nivalis]